MQMDNWWHGDGQPNGEIMYGSVGAECPGCPGLYRFTSSCGRDLPAHILSPDVDNLDGGESSKPRPGSAAVAVMSTNGSECFVVGFQRLPKYPDDDTDETPMVGSAEFNDSPGDRSYRTAGGARMLLRSGGAVILEGGQVSSICLNPKNNTMTLRSTNMNAVADGYRLFRGRQNIGETKPEVVHEEEFLSQVGPSFDRFTVRHGNLDGGGRRELSLSSITVIAGQETGSLLTRETYNDEGHWLGEGKRYQWGADAKEPIVLGNALVTAMNKLMDIIGKLTVNTAWGPSTPPLPATTAALEQLKGELGSNILSKYLFSTQDPTDL
jgi:hypothetical protein